MKQTKVAAIVLAALLAGFVVLRTSQLAAEPILGSDRLAIPSDSAPQKLELAKAQARFQAGDYKGALKLLNEAAKKDADLPPAQVVMAQLFFQAKMSKESQNALEQAVVDAPGDPEAYTIMAGIAMRDSDVAKAESLYRKADSLMPAFDKSVKRKGLLQLQIYSGLAAVAEARKDWAGAQKALEALLKLDARNVAAMQRVAFYLFQQKNADGALEKLREAAKYDPAILTPEIHLAKFYEQSGDRKNAAKWMAAALVAAPKDLDTRLAVGQWAFETGQLDEAQKHATAASKLAPNSLDAKLFRGVVTLFQRDYGAAEWIFEAAVKQSPHNLSATNNLAVALIEQQDESKNGRALELAEANAKQLPKSPELASTYSLVLYRLGRLDDAEKALLTAAPIANSDIDTAYVIARVSVDRGRKAEARQMLESALKSVKPAIFRQDAEELLERLKK